MIKSHIKVLVIIPTGMAILAWALDASGATVTYVLDLTTPGQFSVLARASRDDNFGIVSYGLVLTGPILSLDHNSPKSQAAQGAAGFGPAGFTSLRSADGVTTLLATQDTITPTPHLIRGFGQEASSFAAKGLTNFDPNTEGAVWTADLLLAMGTYDAGAGRPGFNETSFDVTARVFTTPTGPPANRRADIVFVVIPEPATAVSITLALGGLWLFGRRKLTSRLS